MRWGKPRKNFKHRDPRYFLFEQQENSLENLTPEEILKAFEQAGELFLKEPFNILHTKNMPAEKIREQEEGAGDKIQAIKVIEAEDGSVTQQIKNYLVNFVREKIVMQTSSLVIRLLVGIKINALFGPGTVWLVSKIASRVDKSFNVHERIMNFLSPKSLDENLKKVLEEFVPTLKNLFYPRKITLTQIALNIYNKFLDYVTKTITNLLKDRLEAVEGQMKAATEKLAKVFGGKKYEEIGEKVQTYFQKLTPEEKENLLLGNPTGEEMTELYTAITSPTGEMPAVNQPSSSEEERTPTLKIPSLQGNK